MAKKKVAGYGAITYKHEDGHFLTARFGDEIDVHADDVKRLEKLGAFEELAGLNTPQASDVPDSKVASAAEAPSRLSGSTSRKG